MIIALAVVGAVVGGALGHLLMGSWITGAVIGGVTCPATYIVLTRRSR